MSFQAMAWAIEQPVSSTYERFALLMLANFANEQGKCWPSKDTLAALMICSKPTVRKALAGLAEAGLIESEERYATNPDGTASECRLSDIITLRMSAPQGVSSLPRVVNHVDGGGKGDCRGVVNHVDPNLSIEPINEPINDTRPRAREVVGFNSFELQEPFSRFWTAYSKRCAGHNMVARPHCLAKFSAIVSTGVDPETLIAAAEGGNGTNPDPRYTQKPLNWLCDAGWEAKPPVAESDEKRSATEELLARRRTKTMEATNAATH